MTKVRDQTQPRPTNQTYTNDVTITVFCPTHKWRLSLFFTYWWYDGCLLTLNAFGGQISIGFCAGVARVSVGGIICGLSRIMHSARECGSSFCAIYWIRSESISLRRTCPWPWTVCDQCYFGWPPIAVSTTIEFDCCRYIIV